MTKNEKSLLLYLETRGVDYTGKLDNRHLNGDDWKIIKKWAAEGFIEKGRIGSDYLKDHETHWVKLSDKAVDTAHRLRKERIGRMWANKIWKTTEEMRNPD